MSADCPEVDSPLSQQLDEMRPRDVEHVRGCARPFSDGWELHVDSVVATQVESLEAAEDQVRDFLATVFEASVDREQRATSTPL